MGNLCCQYVTFKYEQIHVVLRQFMPWTSGNQLSCRCRKLLSICDTTKQEKSPRQKTVAVSNFLMIRTKAFACRKAGYCLFQFIPALIQQPRSSPRIRFLLGSRIRRSLPMHLWQNAVLRSQFRSIPSCKLSCAARSASSNSPIL